MTQSVTEKMLNQARESCQQNGQRLTAKRERVLSVLLRAETPMSAYDIADAYKQQTSENMPVMSVYRILDFLAANELAHKLSSTNQYLACSHIACEHSHYTPQFLICDHCHRVYEKGLDASVRQALEASVKDSDFTLSHPQLELHGSCEQCRGN